MSKEITIIVSGPAGSGKTTIAHYIRDALADIQVASEIMEVDGSRTLPFGDAGIRLQDFGSDFKVTIKTAQTLRIKP